MNGQPRICVVGAGGFLSWHIQLHAWTRGWQVCAVSTRRHSLEEITQAMADADLVVHLAACNRPQAGGTEADAAAATLAAAQVTARAISCAARSGHSPRAISIAGTTQESTPYARAKTQAAQAIFDAAGQHGIPTTQWLLPRLFGEHGRPRHNMVTSTFIEALLEGERPRIDGDQPMTLLAARHAARLLCDTTVAGTRAISADLAPLHSTSVPELYEHLRDIDEGYRHGGLWPDTGDIFTRELFAAYLSQAVERRAWVPLTSHPDARGSFVETIRTQGCGQGSFSTTQAGVTRGDHLHVRKIERFIVLAGSARIELRKHGSARGSSDHLVLTVSGDQPTAVDMPCGWTHNITNIGPDILYTQFWISEPYDPSDPDTFPEKV